MAEKNALKSVKFAEFESDSLKTDEDTTQQSRWILQRYVWWGVERVQGRAPPPPPL